MTRELNTNDGCGDDKSETTAMTSCLDSPTSNFGACREYPYGSFIDSLLDLAHDSFDEGFLDDRVRRQELWGAEEETARQWRKPWYYANCFSLGNSMKGSNAAMWLGHLAFIAGTIFYLKGALIDLNWTFFSRDEYRIPDEILDLDDDIGWVHWEKNNLDKASRHAIDDMREHYWGNVSFYGGMGGAFFVVCGFAGLMYYGELVDLFMILAGIAGVCSAMSDTTEMEGRWNFVSCHMYLMEAYVMIRRQRTEKEENGGTAYEGYNFFLFSRICFFGGCMMDIFTSYIALSPYESTFLDSYADLASCLLWITCAFVDFGAEIYFTESEEEAEEEEMVKKPVMISM